MELGREIMGSGLIERSTFLLGSSKVHTFYQKTNQLFWVNSVSQKRRVGLRRKAVGVKPVVAAISENLVRAVVPEKAVKYKVRGVVTVRNKNKEDLTETLFKHFDAFTDKIGRNVVLELVSTEIDPSMSFYHFQNLLNFVPIIKSFHKKIKIKIKKEFLCYQFGCYY